MFTFNTSTKVSVNPFSTVLPPTKIKLAFKVSIFFVIEGISFKLVLSGSNKMANNLSLF